MKENIICVDFDKEIYENLRNDLSVKYDLEIRRLEKCYLMFLKEFNADSLIKIIRKGKKFY